MSKRKPPEELEAEALESYIEEHGREPDEQELHDWMNRDHSPRLETTLATPRPPESYHGADPIEMAIRNNPGSRARRQKRWPRSWGSAETSPHWTSGQPAAARPRGSQMPQQFDQVVSLAIFSTHSGNRRQNCGGSRNRVRELLPWAVAHKSALILLAD